MVLIQNSRLPLFWLFDLDGIFHFLSVYGFGAKYVVHTILWFLKVKKEAFLLDHAIFSPEILCNTG